MENAELVYLDCIINETQVLFRRRLDEKGRTGEVEMLFEKITEIVPADNREISVLASRLSGMPGLAEFAPLPR
jgi:hypothetical protein